MNPKNSLTPAVMVVGLLLLALSLQAQECPDPSLEINIATGQDANQDGLDDNWSMRLPNGTLLPNAPLLTPNPSWRGGSALAPNTGPFGTVRYPVLGTGRWIGNSNQVGLYVFETNFVLSGFTEFWIAGEWEADNTIHIFLNGNDTGITSNGNAIPPAPWLSNSLGSSHPCASPLDGLLHPNCDGPNLFCPNNVNFRCSSREDEFRELHYFEISSLDNPSWFNLGGVNTLRVEVTSPEVVAGFLMTGGEGTSVTSGATAGPCPPDRACGALPGDPEPPCERVKCEIDCNAPETIIPPDAPISFTATTSDHCTVEVTGFDCWTINGAGRRVDKKQSCEVDFLVDLLRILDSGGVGDNITWDVTATDMSTGETTTAECGVTVLKPGR